MLLGLIAAVGCGMYQMEHFKWKRDRLANKDAYKICISREDSAIRKGLIADFVYDELK